MRPYMYAHVLLVPAFVLVGLISDGWMTFIAPLVFFTLIPLAELLAPGDPQNLGPEEERTVGQQRVYDALVYSMVAIQWGLMVFFLWRVASDATLSWLEVVGMSASMAMACGVLGINVGHELGHRRKRSEQIMAKALLSSSLYAHFFIEHNRGHHARVATEDDPATARRGETIYTYIPRSMVGGFLSAWHLENDRLRQRGERLFTWKNEMLRLTVFQLGFVALTGLIFGPVAMLGLVLAALGGGVLLETVNYIEHYGLERRKLADGRYERVMPIHSWNANHTIGRIVLFELTRHSDHHANARRKYQVLRHFDEAPQLPTGYPGMIVLSFFPPLFFAIMHPRIDRFRDQLPPLAEAGELATAA